ncbi:MAG TPA: MerR family transcriptional regulator [Clostridia bacterium]|nr:MerR family transcriptional regulator [Clostridia bacterium]
MTQPEMIKVKVREVYMAVYTRREAAEKTGISFDTLRYYESFGVINQPKRSQNNYRQYDEDDIERLLFIKQAKKCGFSLKEIAETFILLENTETCNKSSDKIIDAKINQIDQKINELIRMKEMLAKNKEILRNASCHQFIKDSLNILR